MKIFVPLFLFLPFISFAQVKWKNVDALYQPLPRGIDVFYTNDSIDGKPNIAYYVQANLKDRQLVFTTDTTRGRRFTPLQFFERDNHPLLVVNTTFFEFVHNSSINVVMKDGKMLFQNGSSIAGRGKDTFTYKHPTGSAIGISKKRKADVAWLYTDSSSRWPLAFEENPVLVKDSFARANRYTFVHSIMDHEENKKDGIIKHWKMQTAVGGGPALLQNGEIRITNNEELRFMGKAINDKHPRTAMGYTKDGELIILVVQGRFAGIAEGATLVQEAKMLKDIGCVEALNLDGGGSSCMLVNGKQTIQPSDKEGERAVPSVFIIHKKS